MIKKSIVLGLTILSANLMAMSYHCTIPGQGVWSTSLTLGPNTNNTNQAKFSYPELNADASDFIVREVVMAHGFKIKDATGGEFSLPVKTSEVNHSDMDGVETVIIQNKAGYWGESDCEPEFSLSVIRNGIREAVSGSGCLQVQAGETLAEAVKTCVNKTIENY